MKNSELTLKEATARQTDRHKKKEDKTSFSLIPLPVYQFDTLLPLLLLPYCLPLLDISFRFGFLKLLLPAGWLAWSVLRAEDLLTAMAAWI